MIPPENWPAAAAAEAAVFSKLLAADPDDAGALVGRAAVFENHKLLANAWPITRRSAVNGKTRSGSRAKSSSFPKRWLPPTPRLLRKPAGGKTYALLIGVSKYQRLPKDQWLQFAEADATVFEKHVLSPRGGSLPPENVLRLTDEKATTAAMRNAFQTFLKGRATKKDTVLILIAGHGTVESPGSKKAFILTHDSDPQDLAGTALPMGEVQTLIDRRAFEGGPRGRIRGCLPRRKYRLDQEHDCECRGRKAGRSGG